MPDIKDKTSLQHGVVVDTTLPFKVYPLTDVHNDLSPHNELAFDIIDAFSSVDSSDARDRTGQYKALEHKLTTILHLLRFLLASQQSLPDELPVSLSASTLQWDNSRLTGNVLSDIRASQQLGFDIYPSTELPWPIKRIGEVIEINGSTIMVRFLPLDAINDERFAKWIFQLHRRSVQKQKQ